MQIRNARGLEVTRALGVFLVLSSGCGEDGSSADSEEGRGGGSSGASAGTSGASAGRAGSASGGRAGMGSAGTSGRMGTGGASGGSAGSSVEAPSLSGCAIFPADNPWNQDISDLPVHPNSDAFVNSMGRNAHVHPDFGTEWEGAPIGIPYVTVSGDAAKVPIEYTAYGDESDPGPFPIPPNAPIEGGPDSDGDRHVLVVDTDNCVLYELYRAFPVNGGARWQADSGAQFDLKTNDEHPFTYTSADAAGLPILPGLVRYDEVVLEGELNHAVRFTASRTRAALVAPARHYASNSDDSDLPPMGLRMRMKASFDCSDYSSEAQVVCAGLKTYGMILADNGSNWYLSGAPDPRWDDEALGDLKDIPGDAFEAVDTGPIRTY